MKDKFLSVEMIIAYIDSTWTTDYVEIPYPEAGELLDETIQKAKTKFAEEEEIKAEQRGSVGPSIAYVGIYNINWDEPLDKDGNPFPE